MYPNDPLYNAVYSQAVLYRDTWNKLSLQLASPSHSTITYTSFWYIDYDMIVKTSVKWSKNVRATLLIHDISIDFKCLPINNTASSISWVLILILV